jgi:hypothetical protein
MEDVMGDADGRVPVADFVAGPREELKAAQAARDPELQFKVGPVQVKFSVVTGREGGPEGKVRFWVIVPRRVQWRLPTDAPTGVGARL